MPEANAIYSGDKLTAATYDNLPGGFCPAKFETNGTIFVLIS